ncbi:ribonuclease H2, subunit C [Nemania sp. FL0031]|nr:ribonuclease H2, subunit C [Nemania sp. FL0031]
MSPPLFTIESSTSGQEKATVNLLPCRIYHDGDVSASDAMWNPTKTQDGSKTAYLRGRKLHGKALKLPDGYRGMVVEQTEAKPDTSSNQELADEDVQVIENPEDQLKVGAMKGKAAFDELVVWGHESTSDSTVDPYVRGMEEWIAFAGEIHSSNPDSESPSR